ncbi:MAG: P-loop NTPase [Myxococcota bacterium]|nr:P-loop NTPase [Myxococcota bacterium]
MSGQRFPPPPLKPPSAPQGQDGEERVNPPRLTPPPLAAAGQGQSGPGVFSSPASRAFSGGNSPWGSATPAEPRPATPPMVSTPPPLTHEAPVELLEGSSFPLPNQESTMITSLDELALRTASPVLQPTSTQNPEPPQSAFAAPLPASGGRVRPAQLSTETSIRRLADFQGLTENSTLDDPSEGAALLQGATSEQEAVPQAPLIETTVRSKMIVCFAPRGGVGATLSALNIAGILSTYGHETVVVDMDLQMGAIPRFLNLNLERSLAEILGEVTEEESGPIHSAIDRHRSGIGVIAQEERIGELGIVTPESLPRFFDAVASSAEYVIVDGVRNFSDHSVAVMDLAHQIVLVVTQDVASIRVAQKSMRLFRRLGYGSERFFLVVNRFSKRSALSVELIEQSLSLEVRAILSEDAELTEQAINEGVLLPEVNPKAKLCKDYLELTKQLVGIETPEKKKGFLSRFFGRG